MSRTRPRASSDVYCEWEGARFPREQFDPHKAYGLVHVRGLSDDTPHHTVAGDRLPPAGGDGAGTATVSRGGGGGVVKTPVTRGPYFKRAAE
jgi:hypothetical protein